MSSLTDLLEKIEERRAELKLTIDANLATVHMLHAHNKELRKELDNLPAPKIRRQRKKAIEMNTREGSGVVPSMIESPEHDTF